MWNSRVGGWIQKACGTQQREYRIRQSQKGDSSNEQSEKPEKCPLYAVIKTLDDEIGGSWFALDMGQSPIHFLWYAQLHDFDRKKGTEARTVYAEESDTALEAVQAAVEKARVKYSKGKSVERHVDKVAAE
jgi:hypothetical protein